MKAFLVVVCSVFALLAIWVVIRQVRILRRVMRPAKYVPLVDPNPPPLVVRTRGVVAVSAVGLVWAALHMFLAVAWVISGYVVERTAVAGIVGVYIFAAGLVTAIGCLMLLRCERYGRRTIAMGGFLFALAAFMGAAVGMLFPRTKDVPSRWIEAAVYVVVLMAVHLLIDGLLGAAAQRVGLPPPAGDEERAASAEQ